MGFLSNNFISDFFRMLLDIFYGWTGQYWIAIIILTILIRLLMLPLDMKQRKSSMKMAKLQGKMAEIKKRYASDQRKQNEKIQELYRKEGVSPTAGCLPMLLQLPIFFALLGAINHIANVQLAQMVTSVQPGEVIQLQPWLWVRNILQPDSGLAPVLPEASKFIQSMKALPSNEAYTAYKAITEAQYNTIIQPTLDFYKNAGGSQLMNGWFILPILAGGSSYLQNVLSQKSGMQAQPQQGGMMMKLLFPVMSIWICTTASSIFSLYWLTSNVYAIAQQSILIKIYKSKGGDDEELRGMPVEEEKHKKERKPLKEGEIE